MKTTTVNPRYKQNQNPVLKKNTMQRPKRSSILKTIAKPITTPISPNVGVVSSPTLATTTNSVPTSDNTNNINFLILNLNNTNNNNNNNDTTMHEIKKYEYSSVPILDLTTHMDDNDKEMYIDRKKKRRNCRAITIQQVRYMILLITNRAHILNVFQKRTFITICCYLCFHSVIFLYDSVYRTYEIPFLLHPSNRTSDSTKSITNNNNNKTFSIVINTYKRPERLYNSIIHYGHTCGKSVGIDTIYIIWAEEDTQPPHNTSFYNRYDSVYNKEKNIRQHTTNNSSSRSNNNYSNRATIQIIRVKNSLNNRFLPLPRNNSNSNSNSAAIFMVDDDIRVDCLSLQYAYSAWTISPMSMVGFYPRLILSRNTNSPLSTTTNGGQQQQEPTVVYDYHTWPTVYMYNRMNIILTKACFIHERYLHEYTSNNHPIEIKNYINQYKNCEDIAMSLLVINITHYEKQQYIVKMSHLQQNQASLYNLPVQQEQLQNELVIIEGRPIYVEGTVVDDGTFGGISTGTGHMKRRSQCINDIITIYKNYNWTIPLFRSSSITSTGSVANTAAYYRLHESSYVQHQPKLLQLYLTRPSNFLEWFGIPTMFL